MLSLANAIHIPLRDKSIHCCVTSPPYYGLRSYVGEQVAEWEPVTYTPMSGVQSITVPGCDPDCNHEWQDSQPIHVSPKRDHDGSNGFSDTRGEEPHRHATSQDLNTGQWCSLCGGWRGALGLEPTVEMFVAHIVAVFREVWRVLRDDGTLWLNFGDSFAGSGKGTGRKKQPGEASAKQLTNAGSWLDQRTDVGNLKPKDLIGIPWRIAFALQADGWYLRSAITWCKGSPMPESVTDRPAKATEQVFLLAKSPRYFFDNEALRGVAKSLNQLNRSDEVPLELIANRSTSARLAAQRGKISLMDQWTPYLILAALLSSERVLVEERRDDFRKILDAFKSPADRGTSIAILASLLWVQSPTELITNVLKHLLVILSEGDLDGEAELWIRLRSFSCAMEGHNAAFTVEEANKVMTKVITDAQAIRNAFPLDAVSECFVDVDVVYEAIPLLQAAYSCSSHVGNGLITKTLLEQFDLALRSIRLQQRRSVVRHDNLHGMGNLVPSQYTTETPADKRNAWDWWVINPHPYLGSHFAVYPPALVAPCIKAGTSQRGVCPICKAPWKRVVEKTVSQARQQRGYTESCTMRNDGVRPGSYINGSSITTGWRPTCDCVDIVDSGALDPNTGAGIDIEKTPDPIPATILDPFCGSGTTGQVAKDLRRSFVLLDISHEYLHTQAKKRAEGIHLVEIIDENGDAQLVEKQQLTLF